LQHRALQHRALQHRATQQRQGAADGTRLNLAGLAARYGYYDQAHLDAEFRAIAGSAPTTWLAAEFRNLQAGVTAAQTG
jgi:AraC-like DNA-binding protein